MHGRGGVPRALTQNVSLATSTFVTLQQNDCTSSSFLETDPMTATEDLSHSTWKQIYNLVVSITMTSLKEIVS